MKRCLFVPILSFITLPVLAETPSKSSEASLIGALRKSGLPATEKSISIPIKSTILGLEVEGQINGQPVHFILDTGAAVTIISPELAAKLDLKATESNANLFSSTGEQVVNQASVIKRITIGTAWTENEPVIVSKQINGIDAMLGIATLADCDVRIDPVTNTLTMFPAGKAPSLEGETVVPLKCNIANPEASVSIRKAGAP